MRSFPAGRISPLRDSCGSVTYGSGQSEGYHFVGVHAAYELPEIRAAVISRFGNRVVRLDGSIDRHAVAAQVFSRPRDLEFLESLLHPVVRRHLVHVIASAADGRVVVAEVPLLFEAGWQDMFDTTIALGADAIVRYHRTEHMFSDVEFAMREALQVDDQKRRALADRYFDNSGGRAELAAWVADFMRHLRASRADLFGGEAPAGSAAAPAGTPAVIDVVRAAHDAAQAWGNGAEPVLSGALARLGAPHEVDWKRVPPGGRLDLGDRDSGSGLFLVILEGTGSLEFGDGSSEPVVVGRWVAVPPRVSQELVNTSAEEPIVLVSVAPAAA